MCAGACGYLLKKTPPARLLDAIRELQEGGAPMSPQIARQVVKLFRNVAPPEESPVRLTPNEAQVLHLLVEGRSYKTAANEMNLTIHAVSFHARHVYEKLHVHSKSEAVAKALRTGVASHFCGAAPSDRTRDEINPPYVFMQLTSFLISAYCTCAR